ncbi:MAG: phosphatase PAP2 family protein [Lachnospiraceae bacterium]
MEFQFLYWIQQFRSPGLDEFMTAITFLGDGGWFWIALGAVLLAVPKTRKTGAAVLISLAVGFILGNLILKNAVARQRPCWLDQAVPLLIKSPTDYSFPSGHSLASFEGAVSIFLYHKKWGIAAVILAVLIACSRMYLFVHFPSDVLAGSLLGILIAVLVHKWLEDRAGRQNQGAETG